MRIAGWLAALIVTGAAGDAVAQIRDNGPLLDSMAPANPGDAKAIGIWVSMAGIDYGVPPGPNMPTRKWIRLGGDAGGLYFARFDQLDGQATARSTLKFERFKGMALKPGGELMRSEVTELEFDCAGKNSRAVSVIAYADHMAAGLRSPVSTNGPWTPLTPGTVIAQVGSYACQNYRATAG
jgi:hypothetical protein